MPAEYGGLASQSLSITPDDSPGGGGGVVGPGPDTFVQTTAVTSGPLDGGYLWSNSANWTAGVPGADANVATALAGYDDIASLSLNELIETSSGSVTVTGGTLNIGTVSGGADTELFVFGEEVDATTPINVTVGSVTGTGGFYGAAGPTSTFIDNSATDLGQVYLAQDGGVVELAATPAASSFLEYSTDGLGTFVLEDPAASNAVELSGVRQGDVLELPGTSVTAASFGASSFSVTTNDGTFDFTNVFYATNVSGYTAVHDFSTCLLYTSPSPRDCS